MKSLLMLSFLAICLCACQTNPPASAQNETEPMDESPASPRSVQTEEPAEGPSLVFLQQKYADGIDFYARGNEPSWGLDMDLDKVFTFTSLTDIASLVTPPVEPALAQDANVKRYAVEVESGSMIITIAQGECMDNMSGEKFDYKVTVEAKNGNMENMNAFSGCGRYVPDFRLTDIWVLEKLGEEAISAENFRQGLPNLEPKAGIGTFLGNTGCNQMNGKFSCGNGRISFSDIATTRMACQGDYEVRLTKALSSARFYTLENLRLTLLNGGKEELAVFKKVD